MDLKLSEVAELLNVSETTIQRWVTEGSVPSYQLNQEFRFNRGEIEDWVMSAKQGGHRFFAEHERDMSLSQSAWNQYGLYRAIHKGGVLDQIEETDKQLLIQEVMRKISSPLSLDADLVSELLIDRENLMPTSLGRGIAVPHTRDFLLRGLFDAVTVVFPKTPIDWGSLDGEPVHTIFFLFGCDDRRHLNLLAKLAHLASSDEALGFLKTSPRKPDLLGYIKNWEAAVRTANCIL
jgi:PTS system nitrogen regulatory IIA component